MPTQAPNPDEARLTRVYAARELADRCAATAADRLSALVCAMLNPTRYHIPPDTARQYAAEIDRLASLATRAARRAHDNARAPYAQHIPGPARFIADYATRAATAAQGCANDVHDIAEALISINPYNPAQHPYHAPQ